MSAGLRTRGIEIALRGVSVRYGQRTAVHNVTMLAPAGDVTAIIGPSGVGKSSLLTTMNRINEVSGGRVTGSVSVGGRDVASMDANDLRRDIGLILQRPTPFSVSIFENLAFPLRAHGTPREQIPARVEEALRRVALWEEVRGRLDAPATALSGGQQQRLCIARALALGPHALLCDEPCASLDPRSMAAVEHTLASLRGQMTLVLVTHNLAQARRLAQHVVALWPGEDGAGVVVDAGEVARVFSAPAHPELAAWVSGAIG